MLCHLGNVKLEKYLKEVGVCTPHSRKVFAYFPPYRFKKNIDFVNSHIGISVTRVLLLEYLINPLRRGVVKRAGMLSSFFARMGASGNPVLNALHRKFQRKFFGFGLTYRENIRGYRRIRKKDVPETRFDRWRARVAARRFRGRNAILGAMDAVERRVYQHSEFRELSLSDYWMLRKQIYSPAVRSGSRWRLIRSRRKPETSSNPAQKGIGKYYLGAERRMLDWLGRRGWVRTL